MKRKTRKRKGGNPEIFYYASFIKNKKEFNTDKFKKMLDKIQNPLYQLYDFDGDGTQYTINEYALIHESDIMVQQVFNYYQANLEHLVQYKFREHKLTILEAYILHSKFVLNIQHILEQIKTTNNYKPLFRYFVRDIRIPTVLMCAIEASKYKNSMFANTICQSVLELYSNTEIYNILSNRSEPTIVLQLFQFATMFNKQDFMIKIYLFLVQETKDIHSGFNLIFDEDVITNILLLDDPNLYKTTIELMNYSDKNVVKEILIDYANQNYDNEEKQESSEEIIKFLEQSGKNSKKLFEKLGKHIIKNVFLPDNDEKIRIIIVCHGAMIDETVRTVEFPFNKLCFFVEKGEKLRNHCIVSRSIEELVCAGNYDKHLNQRRIKSAPADSHSSWSLTDKDLNSAPEGRIEIFSGLKCNESDNGKINIDNMIFSFENKTLHDINNQTSGFYICENHKVSKLNILYDSEYYTLEKIIKTCEQLCKQMKIKMENVNLLLFACRGTNVGNPISPEPIILEHTHNL